MATLVPTKERHTHCTSVYVVCQSLELCGTVVPGGVGWGSQGHRAERLTSTGDACPIDGHFTHCAHWSFLPESLLSKAVWLSFPRLRTGDREVCEFPGAHLQDCTVFLLPPSSSSPQTRRTHLATAISGRSWGLVLSSAWNVTPCIMSPSLGQLFPKASLRTLTWPCYVMPLLLPIQTKGFPPGGVGVLSDSPPILPSPDGSLCAVRRVQMCVTQPEPSRQEWP